MIWFTYLQGKHHLPLVVSLFPPLVNLTVTISEKIIKRSFVLSFFIVNSSGIFPQCCSVRSPCNQNGKYQISSLLSTFTYLILIAVFLDRSRVICITVVVGVSFTNFLHTWFHLLTLLNLFSFRGMLSFLTRSTLGWFWLELSSFSSDLDAPHFRLLDFCTGALLWCA